MAVAFLRDCGNTNETIPLVLKPAYLVLLTAFVVLLFNSGARFIFGLTLHPMGEDLGWSRTTLSLTVTVFMIVSASALPFAGRMVDRLGAAWVLAAGVLLSGAAVASMSLVDSPVQAFLLYGVVFALGSAATSVTPIGVLVTRWFPDRIGMANSVAIAGMGVGQLLIISVLAAQMASIGWRGAYGAVGLATLVFVLPLVFLIGRLSPPAHPNEPGTPARRDEQHKLEVKFTSIGQALRSPRFWLVLLVYIVCGFQDFLMATHVVAFALDEGVSTLVAGNMLAFMGLAGLVGVLLAGLLNDRYGPVVPTQLNFVLRIVLFGLVLWSHQPVVIVLAALLYGMTFWMTAPLAVVFARLFCGFALLGTLSGLITMAHHFAGGLGALFGARVFDLSGSYDVAMWVMLGMSLLGLVLTTLMRGGATMPSAS